MHEMEPEGGRYIAQWARILMRPNLRHIEQACDSLEQSVMGDGAEAELPPEPQIRGALWAPFLCLLPGAATDRPLALQQPVRGESCHSCPRSEVSPAVLSRQARHG